MGSGELWVVDVVVLVVNTELLSVAAFVKDERAVEWSFFGAATIVTFSSVADCWQAAGTATLAVETMAEIWAASVRKVVTAVGVRWPLLVVVLV